MFLEKFPYRVKFYTKEVKLYAKYIDGKVVLCEWDTETSCSGLYGVEPYTGMTPGMKERLWLPEEKRNYVKILEAMAAGRDESKEQQMKGCSEIFGEITIPVSSSSGKTFFYSDQLGLFSE